jgi:hypothetical protein
MIAGIPTATWLGLGGFVLAGGFPDPAPRPWLGNAGSMDPEGGGPEARGAEGRAVARGPAWLTDGGSCPM